LFIIGSDGSVNIYKFNHKVAGLEDSNKRKDENDDGKIKPDIIAEQFI
jgi:hypothetical protein